MPNSRCHNTDTTVNSVHCYSVLLIPSELRVGTSSRKYLLLGTTYKDFLAIKKCCASSLRRDARRYKLAEMDDPERLVARIKAQNLVEFYVERSGAVYLDSAGAPIPSQLMLKNIFDSMVSHPLGNPHSSGITNVGAGDFSSRSSHVINDTRDVVLKYFGATAEQYDLVFTAGSTDAIKLVGETFPFGENGIYIYPSNAHTSLLGIRCYSNNVRCIPLNKLCDGCDRQGRKEDGSLINESDDITYNLLSISGECNFSGAKLNLQKVSNIIKNHDSIVQLVTNATVVKEASRDANLNEKWLWLLDASKLAQSSSIDLSTMEYQYRPNFVAISFYKMFGYPTGLGALLIRRDSASILKKQYYGGGTIAVASAICNYTIHRTRNPHDYLEDGTSNFYGIAAIPHGFAMYHRYGGMSQITEYLIHLTKVMITKLMLLTHDKNGNKFCTIYGNHYDAIKLEGTSEYSQTQGPVITFNAYWENGEEIGFAEFGALAKSNSIHIRTGCFCNVGACADSLNLTFGQIKYNYSQGRVCDDDTVDIVDGKNTGAIRISFGLYNDVGDCEKFIDFIKGHFMNRNKLVPVIKPALRVAQSTFLLKCIYVYPVKSCAGINVHHWPVCSEGLKYDREFAILDNFSGTILTQKVVPKLALILPSIDISKGVLTLTVRECTDQMEPSINVSLSSDSWCCDSNATARICGRKVIYNTINENVDLWLSKHMGKSVRLIRFAHNKVEAQSNTAEGMTTCSSAKAKSFTNDSPFLLLSEESVLDLHAVTKNSEGPTQFIQRLRPNFVISGACVPYYEDEMERMMLTDCDGNCVTFVSNGMCQRCTAVDVNSLSGEKDGNLFATMSEYRKQSGKITLGHLLALDAATLGNIQAREVCISSGINVELKFV